MGELTSPFSSSFLPGPRRCAAQARLQVVLLRRPGCTSGGQGGAQPSGIWALEGKQAEKGGGRAKTGGAARTLSVLGAGAPRTWWEIWRAYLLR